MGLNGKRQTSLSRKEASRANGAKSKGPITDNGKASSRKNALKHGLLSAVIAFEDTESKEALGSLIRDLTEDLQPHGRMEEILVEEIAVCYWRLRRALTAEEGEISSNIQSGLSEMEIENENLRVTAALTTLDPQTRGREAMFDAVRLRSTKPGVDKAAWLLQMMLIQAESNGYYSETYDQELQVLFADKISFYANLQAWNSKARSLAQKLEVGEHEGEEEDSLMVQPADLIKLKLEELESLQEKMRQAEAAKSESLAKSLHLPPAERSEQILRYETTIKRHLYRAMDQLERLQRRRKGEYVPPPVKVGIQKED